MIEKTVVYKVEVSGEAFDDKKAWDYEDFDETSVSETSKLAEYKTKAAAHVRYNQMCLNLQKGLNDLVDLKATGGDHLTVPSKLEFKLIYTQVDGLVYEITEDEYEESEGFLKTRDGRFFKTGDKAIEALIEDAAKGSCNIITNYWNPEENDKAHAPMGVEFNEIEVPASSASVTVEKLIG